MSQAQTMAAANIRVFINGIVMPNISSLQYSISNGEEEIFGIDSQNAQEISSTKSTVNGTISGIRIKSSGGLQSRKMVPLLGEVLEGNYFSIRIEDSSSGFNILFVPYAKVSREDTQIQAKGTVKFSLNFVGILARQELDIVN
jgi:hypothetical protein